MRTKLLLIAAMLFLVAGCQSAAENKKEVKPVDVPPPAVVDEDRVEVEPVEPVEPEVLPSYEYRKGYWDGYTGTWLGPFSWTFSSEYRHGWAMGNQDRKAGNEPKYPKG